MFDKEFWKDKLAGAQARLSHLENLDRIAEASERGAIALERIASALENGAAHTGNGAGPQAAVHNLDTFAGFPCSEIVDVNGLPKFIHAPGGQIAHLRKGDGDRWYSVFTGRDDSGKKLYERILGFKEGEPVPAIKKATPPDTSAPAPAAEKPPPPDNNPPAAEAKRTPAADPALLKKIHAVGKDIYGDEWGQTGPHLIESHTDGQSRSSADLSQAQAEALLETLQRDQIPF